MKPDTPVVDEPVQIEDWSPRNSNREYAGEIDVRGEFVIVLGAQETAGRLDADDPEGPYAAARELVERAVARGEPRSAAVRRLATLWGLERRRLWNLAHADGAAPEDIDDER